MKDKNRSKEAKGNVFSAFLKWLNTQVPGFTIHQSWPFPFLVLSTDPQFTFQMQHPQSFSADEGFILPRKGWGTHTTGSFKDSSKTFTSSLFKDQGQRSDQGLWLQPKYLLQSFSCCRFFILGFVSFPSLFNSYYYSIIITYYSYKQLLCLTRHL